MKTATMLHMMAGMLCAPAMPLANYTRPVTSCPNATGNSYPLLMGLPRMKCFHASGTPPTAAEFDAPISKAKMKRRQRGRKPRSKR